MNQVSSRAAKSGRWFYDRNAIQNHTPSRRDRIDAFDELRFRQTAASFIQECGKQLQLTQLCINTAIVFMHRFFMMHSFKRFDKFDIAASSLFLAAKVEETPRKINHVIEVRDKIANKGQKIPRPDTNSDEYKKRVELLVEHELIMLQTFGFDISIDHPHTHVIRATQFMRAPRELSQVAYFMATNSLYLTTFCLEMRSEVVAATCIYLAFAWSEFEVGLSSDGRSWWSYLDENLTEESLKENVRAYIKILQDHPTRLKEMQQQCESQNANPRSSDSKKSDMRSKIGDSEPNRRATLGGVSMKRSGEPTSGAHHDSNNHPPESKRIKTDSKPDAKSDYTEDKKPNPVLPPILLPGQKKGPVQNLKKDKDHRRSAPATMNQESSRDHKSRPNAHDLMTNRDEGGSYMDRLKDINFVKQCLKSRELWQQLSDEEKAYCIKAKKKIKERKELDMRRRQERQAGSSREAIRGPPPPSETKAATDSLLDEF